jgi:hypothetical protein
MPFLISDFGFNAGPESSFKELLARAVSEQVITDRAFSDPKALPQHFKRKIGEPQPPSHAGDLAILLPKLRNDYFHGTALLDSELLHLALEVREAADALTMPRTPAWKKGAGE